MYRNPFLKKKKKNLPSKPSSGPPHRHPCSNHSFSLPVRFVGTTSFGGSKNYGELGYHALYSSLFFCSTLPSRIENFRVWLYYKPTPFVIFFFLHPFEEAKTKAHFGANSPLEVVATRSANCNWSLWNCLFTKPYFRQAACFYGSCMNSKTHAD